MNNSRLFLLSTVMLVAGCGGSTLAERRVDSAPAVRALQDGRFDEAYSISTAILEKQPETPESLIVRAITRHRMVATQMVLDAQTLAMGLEQGGINQRYLQATVKQAEADLALVDKDLAEAQKSTNVSLELCLACWKDIDWNGDGRINHRDELLLQIEVDAKGQPIPDGDPRRMPTFRFDDGDIAWARAFVGFERAALDLVLAYDFTGVNELLRGGRSQSKRLVLKLVDKERIADAKIRLLEAIDQSAACRRAFLAETDDDREWVPNPRQKNHPMPLEVDQALYDTWGGVLEDLKKIVNGDEGIAVADVADLFKREIRVSGARGFVDVGAMLNHPKDIVLVEEDLEIVDKPSSNVSAMLSTMLGEYYVPSMKASALPKRLSRMKGEIDEHQDDIETKLRYMFWLN